MDNRIQDYFIGKRGVTKEEAIKATEEMFERVQEEIFGKDTKFKDGKENPNWKGGKSLNKTEYNRNYMRDYRKTRQNQDSKLDRQNVKHGIK
jgi:hypothetical protein